MRSLRKLCKSFFLLAVCSLIISAVVLSTASAKEESQDPDYYKYLKRVEAYNMEKTQLSSSAIATYGADSKSSTESVAPGKSEIRNGIDISQWNGTIDWKKVKNAGFQFVIVRAAFRRYGDGIIVDDLSAVENLKAAKKAGLEVGAYIYSQAITQAEAREEAQRVINIVTQSGVELDMPIVMDLEYDPYLSGRLYKKNLSVAAVTGICKAFASETKAKGYEPMIYANRSMFADQMDSLQVEKAAKIWLAEWGTTQPKYTGAYDMWQYSETGRVDGISGNVDLDYQYIPRVERKMTGGATILPGASDTVTQPAVPANTDTIDNTYVTYTPLKAEEGKVIAPYVNVRKGPGTNYKALGSIEKNYKFTVNGKYKDVNGMLWYRVAINLNGVSKRAYISSDYVCLKSDIPKAPVLKQTTQTMTTIKLRWSSVTGAQAYKIYRYNTKTGKYNTIATVGADTTSYTDRGLISYKQQKYFVRAIKYKYVNEIVSVSSNVRIGYTGGLKGYVNKSNGLNVYGTSTSTTVRCKLNNNERVNIVKTVGSRYKVYYDHGSTTKIGYVLKKYIRVD